MSSQLDILALEPFYGGIRRSMLETLMRCSRHRWTLLKLPPRRIERRLSAAAHWFAEQLSRHWAGRVDLLFTSEALNLADLLRLMPTLRKKPSVVYFHANELPIAGHAETTATAAHDLVNLNTAQAATELWFNSQFHIQNFTERAGALVDRHPELSSRDPIPDLLAKTRLMLPPIDLALPAHVRNTQAVQRNARTIFAESRNADMKLLNEGLGALQRRGVKFELLTVGPAEEISPDFNRRTVSESDDAAQVRALLEASVFFSAQREMPMDLHAIRAIAAGCIPIVPNDGFYPELIPKPLHRTCLYELDDNPEDTADNVATRVQNLWHMFEPEETADQLARAASPYDAINTCRAIDERLGELAAVHGKK